MANCVVKPEFPLDRTLATPGALKALQEAGQSPDFFLIRHIQGDWGEVNEDDKRLNDKALVDGTRLLSGVQNPQG